MRLPFSVSNQKSQTNQFGLKHFTQICNASIYCKNLFQSFLPFAGYFKRIPFYYHFLYLLKASGYLQGGIERGQRYISYKNFFNHFVSVPKIIITIIIIIIIIIILIIIIICEYIKKST